jgi:predicted enzyme related to lactoylglutathione lyase
MSLPVDEQITFLYTTDIQTAIPFYEDALGLELALDQGGCRIYHVNGRTSYIGICQREVPREPNGVIFTFVTQDVDAWYERITSKGITCEHAPRTNHDYGIYHFFVKDPNGYLIEVQRFLNDDWDQSKS